MMLRRFLNFVSVSFLSLTLNVHAAEKKTPYYISFDAGASFPISKLTDAEYDKNRPSKSTFFGIGIGKILNKYIRTELSISHRNHYKYQHSKVNAEQNQELAEQTFNNYAGIVNLYYNLPEYRLLTPYFILGIGISRNYSSKYLSYVANVLCHEAAKSVNYDLSWNIGLGTIIKISDNIYAGISYKYLDLGKLPETKYKSVLENNRIYKISPGRLQAHEIGLKIVYQL